CTAPEGHSCLENIHREVDEDAHFVAIAVVVAGIVGYTQIRAAQAHAQILGCTILHYILQLVEEFALGAITTASAVVDVGTADISHVVAQTRNTVFGEVQTITNLPGALVLGVKVRPERVGHPDGGAAITHSLLILVEAIVVTGVTAAALISQSKVMRTGGVVGGQAPQVVAITRAIPLLVLLGAVAAEAQSQGIAAVQGTDVVQVGVLTLEHVFNIRGI